MKKDDRYQQSRAYFEENQRMLDEKTYQQSLRRDKLTAREEIAFEAYMLNKNIQDNEQAKKELAEEAKRAAE